MSIMQGPIVRIAIVLTQYIFVQKHDGSRERVFEKQTSKVLVYNGSRFQKALRKLWQIRELMEEIETGELDDIDLEATVQFR